MFWHSKVHRDAFAVRVSRAESRLMEAMRELETLMDEIRDCDESEETYVESAAEMRANL